jgi:hypothetical protein
MSDALFNVEQDDQPVRSAPGKTPDDGPWGIKWIAGRDRHVASLAAKRAKQTIGEWLGEAIRAYVEEERADYTLIPPRQALIEQETIAPPLSVEDIGRVLDYAERIAAIRGRKPSRRLLAGVDRILVARLR